MLLVCYWFERTSSDEGRGREESAAQCTLPNGLLFVILLPTAFRNAWANSIHTKSDDDTSSRKMLYPVGGTLYPICWSHVREALTYMDSLGTVVRPCALNTDAVYLTSRGKMGDASMSAVVSQRTLHFMIH